MTASRDPIVTKNHVAEHQRIVAVLEEQTLANVWEAIQFTSITSTDARACMQGSSSDNCQRTVLFTVSIFSKGQINEGCLLGNVEI